MLGLRGEHLMLTEDVGLALVVEGPIPPLLLNGIQSHIYCSAPLRQLPFLTQDALLIFVKTRSQQREAPVRMGLR